MQVTEEFLNAEIAAMEFEVEKQESRKQQALGALHVLKQLLEYVKSIENTATEQQVDNATKPDN